MKKLLFLIPFVAGMMACGMFSSCEKENPVVVNGNQQTTTTTSSTPQSEGYGNSESYDPEGTVWYNISSTESMDLVLSGNHATSLYWRSPANIFINASSYHKASMVRVGKVAGLNMVNINSVPEVGWTSQSACEPGYAYIIKDEISNSGSTAYGAIYVVDHIYSGEGIMGAKIKYCPFTPNVGWNR